MKIKFFTLFFILFFIVPLTAKDKHKNTVQGSVVITTSKIEKGNRAKNWAKHLKKLRKRQILKNLKKDRRRLHRNIRRDCTGKHRRRKKHDRKNRR